MTEEKPLRALVAGALGIAPRVTFEILDEPGTASAIGFDSRWEAEEYLREQHAKRRLLDYHVGPWEHFPRYDEDWSVTGPLIERFGINLNWTSTEGWAATGPAHTAHWREYAERPLLAACLLIIGLADMECLEEAEIPDGVPGDSATREER